MGKTMFIGFSHTDKSGFKLGDSVVAAHSVRLFIQNEPCDKYILSLNPSHPMNFCFDQVVLEYNVEIIKDAWDSGDLPTIYREMDQRRTQRHVNGKKFDIYKEIYLRIHGGDRQGQLCGGEKGLGRRNIFEYFFFGQESAPKKCFGGANFGRESLGLMWRPSTSSRSLFLSPHAFSQGNAVFTMEFWQQVIDRLLNEKVAITVCTPNENPFGVHPLLKYTFHQNNIRGLFDEISRQQLVLCGNTGTGWIAAAHGVPLIAGEPKVFWYGDYRYREAGVQSIVDVFGNESIESFGGNPAIPASVDEPVRMVLEYLEGR